MDPLWREREAIIQEGHKRARDALDSWPDDGSHEAMRGWIHARTELDTLRYKAMTGEQLPSDLDGTTARVMGERRAEIVREYLEMLRVRLVGYPVPSRVPPPGWRPVVSVDRDDVDEEWDEEEEEGRYRPAAREAWDDDDDYLIESAGDALKRQSQGEIINEILAGGAVAASFTAGAAVVKARLEATTQREKNKLDAETERLRIASNERIAGLQAMTRQQLPAAEAEGDEPEA
nr:hypothetical protein StreXyl84_77360 [Streptomyces sp. Xyl84]